MNTSFSPSSRSEHDLEDSVTQIGDALLDQRADQCAAPKSGRRFLIVSAPFGPFSRELAAVLRAKGAKVTRVLLNAGDVLDWGPRDSAPFFGAWPEWADWMEATVRREAISDVVTHGDSSPHAAVCLKVAGDMGVRAHVLEHGYFRPDWVTLESGGVNANSALPREPSWYRDHPAAGCTEDAEIVGRTTPAAIGHITAYHLAMYLGLPVFPRYRAHYSEPAIKQGIGHLARFGLLPFTRGRNRRAYEEMVSPGGPVFLCVLQRPGDSQLWRHSAYASIPVFINRVVMSFAIHAPKEARLIIRPHPLDPGLVPYKSIVMTAARRGGVEDRVRLTDYGKFHEVVPKMAGVVCINSSAGLAAIEFGKPTVALGRAIYNMVGMTHWGSFDEFWRAPQPPDPALYTAFRRVVMASTQINGAYATAKGRQMAVPEIARRLLAA
jgi:capsular polysaccharide export protein